MWQLGTIYQKVTGKTISDFGHWRFRQMFELPIYKANFHDPQEDHIKYVTHDSLEPFTIRFKTWSAIAAQSDDVQEEIALKLKTIIERGEDIKWVDEAEGIFEVPMATPIIIIRRK